MNLQARTSNLISQDRLESEFFLSETEVFQCDRYYILHWSGNYLMSKITEWQSPKDSGDLIHNQGVTYHVHFCKGLTPWDIVQFPHAQYRISFRRYAGDTFGHALIIKSSIKPTDSKELIV